MTPKIDGLTINQFHSLMSAPPPKTEEKWKHIVAVMHIFFSRMANLIFGNHKWENNKRLFKHLQNDPQPCNAAQEILMKLSERVIILPPTATTPSRDSGVEKAKRKLKSMWMNYKEHTETTAKQARECENVMRTMKFDQVQDRAKVNLLPDYVSNQFLFAEFENDPDVAMILPEESESVRFRVDEEGFSKNIAEDLATTFAAGRKLAIFRFSTPQHEVAAVFSREGECVIIDSLPFPILRVNELCKELNKAKIPNQNGEAIEFKGEYVLTNIQNNGHECQRFATLYAYQIAKEKEINGYQKVNGAFDENRLKTLSDIGKIGEARPIRKVTRSKPENYRPFMNSWACQSFGLDFDVYDWKKISLEHIAKGACRGKEVIPAYFLFHDEQPMRKGHWTHSRNVRFSSPPKEIELSQNLSEITIGSVLPSKGKVRVLVPSSDTVIHCYEFNTGNKLMTQCRMLDLISGSQQTVSRCYALDDNGAVKESLGSE